MEADNRIVEAIRGSWPARRGLTLNLQSFWAIADQGVVSLGNFLTTIILARALTPAAYGLWSVIFGLILFLNVFSASLINYPLSVRLAARDDSAGHLVNAALTLTALSLSRKCCCSLQCHRWLPTARWACALVSAWCSGSFRKPPGAP